MQCLPAVLHLHALADRPVVEQFECRVQLQHCSTVSRARWLGRLTVETLPNPPVGVSIFLFRPPDGPAAAADRDTPPAIAWPSLIRLETAAGLSYQELTPLAHSRCPLLRRRPHLHRGVCVCVYICVRVCVYVCIYVCVCV